jgi:hypothetical protein
MIFVQDLRSRSVHWFLFPLLAITLLLHNLGMQGAADTWPSVLVNIGFLVIQFFLVCAWFTLRNGKWTNITVELLGWGDVLFLLSAALGLSVFSFLLFYILSLTVICIYWLLIKALGNSNKQVPLAGLQALLLSIFLSGDWWLFQIGLTGDDWVFKILEQ